MAGSRAPKTPKRIPVREFINIGAPFTEQHEFICPGCAGTVKLKQVAVGKVLDHPCGKQFDLVYWRAVTDEKELERYLVDVPTAISMSFDYETSSLSPFSGKIVGVSFCRYDQPNIAIYVPMRHRIGLNMDPDRAGAIYAPFIATHPMDAYNFVFEYKWSYVHHGVEVKIDEDCQIDCWLEDPNRSARFDPRELKLKGMAEEIWDLHTIRIEDLVDLKTSDFSHVDTKRATPYGCQDSDLTTRIKRHWGAKIKQQQPMIHKLEHQLIPVIAAMELRGIKLNSRSLAEGALKLDKDIEQLERDVFTAMGFEIKMEPDGTWMRPFDLDSNAKVAKQLFIEMGLSYNPRDVGKPTKDFPNGQPSVSKDALSDLRNEYEVVDKILKHSEACHMRDSFVSTLPDNIDPVTGYIHGSFNATGAPTGRFSHSAPNLAQIPKLKD